LDNFGLAQKHLWIRSIPMGATFKNCLGLQQNIRFSGNDRFGRINAFIKLKLQHLPNSVNNNLQCLTKIGIFLIKMPEKRSK
jgi:hypothetical protein